MELAQLVKNNGVVGAGGAGFPTHVKLQSKVEYLLVNGAECEPLMHKDRELMTHFAKDVVAGIELAREAVGASKTVIGIKEKNAKAIAALQQAIDGKNISLHLFGDFYPVGDEYELVYGVTGRLIPPQGLPLDVGCVVNNVETFYNIYHAGQNRPVTQTLITIAGMVKKPVTLFVPVGMLVRDVLELAGGTTVQEFGLMESGLMMGKPIHSLEQPVTKTTGGIIVLPKDHNLIQRYNTPLQVMHRIGHSACDQCSYCTELCPRYLLGYDIQPHLVMRSLGFTEMGGKLWNKYAQLCCQCGICTLYSCPEALFPREACVTGMTEMRKAGKGRWEGSREVKVHPMKDSRRVPLKQLMNRLGVTRYDAEAEFEALEVRPDIVDIPLKQHVGEPAAAVVKKGEKVKTGQLIGDIPDSKLGARIHASIDGIVKEVTEKSIIIERAS